jgi:hypothetical protein
VQGPLLHYIIAILGAAGLGGIAAVLRVFFSRHKHITVKFSETGKLIQAEGLSAGDIICLLKQNGQDSQPSPTPPAETGDAVGPPNYQVSLRSDLPPKWRREK